MKPECIQWRNSHISLKEVRKLTFRSRGPWVGWLTCAIDSLLSVGRFQLFTTALLLLKRRSLYRINCLVDDNEFISINYSLRRNILSTDDSDTAFALCSCDFTYPGNGCWTYRSHTARVCVTHTAHPFLQILPTIVFLFFFRTDSTDFPDCLLILLSISVFLLFSFSVIPLISCWFHAVD